MVKKQIPETASPVLLEERRLVKRIRQGEEAAFHELVERYGRSIYNIGLRMLENREDAADMTQDVLIKVYRSIHSFRGDSALSTWVYRISVNTCRDALRLAYRRRERVFSGFGEEDETFPEQQVADYSCLPEERYMQGEENAYLYALLQGLAPPFRMVMVLREVSGLSYQEIAQAAHISVGTVKSRISRARAAMLKQLKEDMQHYPELQRLVEKGGREDEM